MNILIRKMAKAGMFLILGTFVIVVDKWWYNLIVILGSSYMMLELDKRLSQKVKNTQEEEEHE